MLESEWDKLVDTKMKKSLIRNQFQAQLKKNEAVSFKKDEAVFCLYNTLYFIYLLTYYRSGFWILKGSELYNA